MALSDTAEESVFFGGSDESLGDVGAIDVAFEPEPEAALRSEELIVVLRSCDPPDRIILQDVAVGGKRASEALIPSASDVDDQLDARSATLHEGPHAVLEVLRAALETTLGTDADPSQKLLEIAVAGEVLGLPPAALASYGRRMLEGESSDSAAAFDALRRACVWEGDADGVRDALLGELRASGEGATAAVALECILWGAREPAVWARAEAGREDPAVVWTGIVCGLRPLAPSDAADATESERRATLENDPVRLAEGYASESPARSLTPARLLEAATFYERVQQPDRARDLASRALGAGGVTERRALELLVRLAARAGDEREEARLRSLWVDRTTEPDARADAAEILAILFEKHGEYARAAASLAVARETSPDDRRLLVGLDRLLSRANDATARHTLWTTEAARAKDPNEVREALLRAAAIAEQALGKREVAMLHIRAASALAPGDHDARQALARLLAAALPASTKHDARAMAEFYKEAARHATDSPATRAALLERAAVLLEDLAADPAAAAEVYATLLTLPFDRTRAREGLLRTAPFGGRGRLLVDAVKQANGGEAADGSLELAAARVLAEDAPDEALAILRPLLAISLPPDRLREARELTLRVVADAGRWDEVAKALATAAEEDPDPAARTSAGLAAARLYEFQLRDLPKARGALEALDPDHTAVLRARARLAATDEDEVAAFEALAKGAGAEADEARLRAAEIAEIGLRDDVRARGHLEALWRAGDADETVRCRLVRVLTRQPDGDRLVASLGLVEGAALVSRWLDAGDAARALTAGEALVGRRPGDPGLLALLLRAAEGTPRQGTLLTHAADHAEDRALRRAARWLRLPTLLVGRRFVEAARVARELIESADSSMGGEPLPDPVALRAVVDATMPAARSGDTAARASVTVALKRLVGVGGAGHVVTGNRLRLALLHELAASDAGLAGMRDAREATEAYRLVLEAWPTSFAAATGLVRAGILAGDADAVADGSIAFARLTPSARGRAQFLVEGAEILLGAGGRPREIHATELYEEALEGDPCSQLLATRLAGLRLRAGEVDGLVETLLRLLARAPEGPSARGAFGKRGLAKILAAIVRHHLGATGLGIAAAKRAMDEAPDDPEVLLAMAEVAIEIESWDDAKEALTALYQQATDADSRRAAAFVLSELIEHAFHAPADADVWLERILALDPADARALRRRIHIATKEPGRGREAAGFAEQLAGLELDSKQRSAIFRWASHLYERAQDEDAAERMAIEAALAAPDDVTALEDLLERYDESPKGRAGYEWALRTLVSRSRREGGAPAGWLARLAELEPEERASISLYEEALRTDGSMHHARIALARKLMESGRTEQAVRELHMLVERDPSPLGDGVAPRTPLLMLEEALSVLGRHDEARIARELLAVALREAPPDHPLVERSASHPLLDRPSIASHVLPAPGRHILLEVGATLTGLEAKIVRELAGDDAPVTQTRLGPRGVDPLRAPFDRARETLGLRSVDAVAIAGLRIPRLSFRAGDPIACLPASLRSAPPRETLAASALALARCLVGVGVLDGISDPDAFAVLVAAARVVAPEYAAELLPPDLEARIALAAPVILRNLGRRQRRLIEELSIHFDAPPPPLDTFFLAVRRAELRIAHVVSGGLAAPLRLVTVADSALEARLAAGDPDDRIAALLAHPLAGDLIRYAFEPDAVRLRAKLGTAI